MLSVYLSDRFKRSESLEVVITVTVTYALFLKNHFYGVGIYPQNIVD
jgi:hypothetical protein